jgi:two-component system cell cycle response regulator
MAGASWGAGTVVLRAEPGSSSADGLVRELEERDFKTRLARPDEPLPDDALVVLWVLERAATIKLLPNSNPASPVPKLVLAATRNLARLALEHLGERDDLASLTDTVEVVDWRLRRLLRQHERWLVDTDPVTGLLTRRAFDRHLSATLRDLDPGVATGLIHLDLDRFKEINDLLGHVAGDAALHAVASTITRACRPLDVIARVGGDEFGILLARPDAGSLVRAGRAVLEAIAETDMPAWRSHPTLRFGASAGLTLLRPGVSENDLNTEADVAMYEAKGAGRNCLRVYRQEIRGGDRLEQDLRLELFENSTRVATERLVEAITIRGRRLIDDARRQANVCALTGLYNRRFLDVQLKREIQRARAERVPLSLAMLDVDRFHDVNVTHGWPTGDRVLQALASILRSSVRCTDWSARYGGEEFVVVMPDTTVESAAQVAERFRQAFEATTVEGVDGQSVTATTSVGVTMLAEADSSPVALLQRASKALLRAKDAGRNRVEVEP